LESLSTTSTASPPEEDRQALVFGALADATRRLLIDRLVAGGPARASELRAGLPITRQAVAKHLSFLKRADLVRTDRPGPRARYELRPENLADAVAWLHTIEAEWDRRLQALARYVESQEQTPRDPEEASEGVAASFE
jgi:DNA-binding transcriptional ArsR family regulator